MRENHREVFFGAAQQCPCWIGLREPNPLADRWIGKAGYIPKGENCKAKTAGNPAFQFAGLVVDLTLLPEAFRPDTSWSIARSNLSGEWLPTSKTRQRELFAQVEPILKQGLKLPMIQHPTEFMWMGGIGARELEWVFWFGPGQRFHRGPSSMPRGGH